ncbi:MAG TPA: PQQ-binding-like beta-propeller repeat protein [Acidimicrobiia bacterium]|nr:PQQ-binding-like beta-propeller repeat protein [Acidimicrobiia bacterium]
MGGIRRAWVRAGVSAASVVAVVAGLAASSGAGAQTSGSASEWPQPGGDYANSRTAVGSTVESSNVAGLAKAWEVTTPGSLTTAVVVVGDTIYMEDSRCVITAIDRSTGAVKWRSASVGFTIGPQGVSIGDGAVFATTPTGAIALEQDDGQVRWKQELTETPTEGVDAQPQFVNGKVLIATVPVSARVQYQGGDRGILYALDAKTGDIDWMFDTVGSDDLWGNADVNSGGGAWYPPAVDPKSGLVYWGVANPAPFPGTPEFPNGSSRPGRNLYTDSTVALSLKTGKLRWYRQAVAHDIFDQDFVHALIARVGTGDDARRVVIGAGKGGQVLGMDPGTGKLLWKTAVGVHENHDLTSLTGPTDVMPGTYGGVLTPPATADGVVYVATLNAPATLAPDKTAYFGASVGTQDGEVVAIDAATGKHRWATKVPGDPMGGATVVNDLVITGTYQGQVIALDRTTGKIVTTVDVGNGIAGWPAAVGDLLLVPTGVVARPGTLVAYRLTS